jgi:hypothetical protein
LGGVSKKETSEWQKLDISLTQPKNTDLDTEKPV